MAANPDVIATDSIDLELEAMRKDDYSWHPCQVYFSPNAAGLVIKYVNNGSQDIFMSEKEALTQIRVRSLPLKDDDCTHIKPGEHVVVNHNSQPEKGFFDAEVEKVQRVRHSKRMNCRCTFMIKWLHQDLNGGSLTVPSSSIMRLANKSIDNHPTISAFIDAVPNVLNEFDLDLDDLLEKQIEGIRNSVHGSKKRIRDEILGFEVNNTNEQVKETDICMENRRELPDNRSPLNPLAARAALASLMSKLPQTLENSLNNFPTGIANFSEINELSSEKEAAQKPARIVKKSIFSTSEDVTPDKTNPDTETRLTRAKVEKVKGVLDENNEKSSFSDGNNPSTMTNRRSTRSVLNKEGGNINIETTNNMKRVTRSKVNLEAANIKTETTKASGGNVTSNGGSSYGSKKKSLDLNKQKVRSSPRFNKA